MKKILQIVSCLERGGTEAFIMNHYRALDRKNYQFDFLVLVEKEYPYEDEIHNLGGKIYYGCLPSFKNICRFVVTLVNAIKKHGPYDVVHSHVNITNGWVMLAACIARVPIRISHSHGTDVNRLDVYSVLRKGMIKKLSTNYLACGQEAGYCLYGEKFFRKNGKVIKNGILPEKYIEIDDEKIKIKKKELGITSENSFVIMNISRFDENKNSLFVMEIFRNVLKWNSEAVLIMGGSDGGELEKCKTLAGKWDIEDRIRFIGVRTDVDLCLQTADIYLFPSFHEGLPIVILEAQAAGLHCIISDGVPIEVDLGLGLVSQFKLSESAECWAEKIERIVRKNPVNLDKMTIKKAFRESGYDINISCKELMRVYDGI